MITSIVVSAIVGFFLVAAYVYFKYMAEVIITLIKGAMFGILYNDAEYEDATEHTIQLCLVFVTFTVIWYTE